MRTASIAFALVVSLAFVGKLLADERTAPPVKHREELVVEQEERGGIELNLTAEQKAKIKELNNAYRPKFRRARDSVLTPEQRKMHEEVVKASSEKTFVSRYVTDEQKATIEQNEAALRREFHEKFNAILTPEQQKQLKAKLEERKAKLK